MGEIMNSPNGVKSSVPERVSISCPTCGIRHHSAIITGNMRLMSYCYLYELLFVICGMSHSKNVTIISTASYNNLLAL